MIGQLHPDFVREFLVEHKHTFKDVIDIGSKNENQDLSPVRTIFPIDTNYLGVDMRGGSNVDLVINTHELAKHFPNHTFDLAICIDTFEHDDRFWESWENIKKVIKPGGYILLSVPGRGCPQHEFPSDYYRFLEGSFKDYFFKDFEDVMIRTHWCTPHKEHEAEILGWGRVPR